MSNIEAGGQNFQDNSNAPEKNSGWGDILSQEEINMLLGVSPESASVVIDETQAEYDATYNGLSEALNNPDVNWESAEVKDLAEKWRASYKKMEDFSRDKDPARGLEREHFAQILEEPEFVEKRAALQERLVAVLDRDPDFLEKIDSFDKVLEKIDIARKEAVNSSSEINLGLFKDEEKLIGDFFADYRKIKQSNSNQQYDAKLAPLEEKIVENRAILGDLARQSFENEKEQKTTEINEKVDSIKVNCDKLLDELRISQETFFEEKKKGKDLADPEKVREFFIDLKNKKETYLKNAEQYSELMEENNENNKLYGGSSSIEEAKNESQLKAEPIIEKVNESLVTQMKLDFDLLLDNNRFGLDSYKNAIIEGKSKQELSEKVKELHPQTRDLIGLNSELRNEDFAEKSKSFLNNEERRSKLNELIRELKSRAKEMDVLREYKKTTGDSLIETLNETKEIFEKFKSEKARGITGMELAEIGNEIADKCDELRDAHDKTMAEESADSPFLQENPGVLAEADELIETIINYFNPDGIPEDSEEIPANDLDYDEYLRERAKQKSEQNEFPPTVEPDSKTELTPERMLINELIEQNKKLEERLELQKQAHQKDMDELKELLRKMSAKNETAEDEEAADNQVIAEDEEAIDDLLAKALSGDIVIAGIDEGSVHMLAKDQAREKMEVSKTEKKAGNWFVRKFRAFKDRMTVAIDEARDTAKVKKNMMDTGSLYDTRGSEEATRTALERSSNDLLAIAERMAIKDDEGVAKDAEEEKELLKGDEQEAIIAVLKKFVEDKSLNYTAFKQAKTSLIEQLAEKYPDILEQGDIIAENLWQKIVDIRAALGEAEALDRVDYSSIKVYIAKAKAGVRTEAQLGRIDKLTQKLIKSPISRFINPVMISVGVAAFFTGAKLMGEGSARTLGRAAGALGGAAAVSGGLAGLKEGVLAKTDREWHSREMAQGKGIQEGDKKREDLDKYTYKSEKVSDIRDELTPLLEKVKNGEELSDEEIKAAITSLVNIEARQSLGDGQKIDLFVFSGVGSIETERKEIAIIRSRLKTILNDTGKFDKKEFASLVEEKKDTILGEVTETDKRFKKYKNKRVAKAFVTGATTSLVFGLATQEVGAFFDDKTTGLIERVVKGDAVEAAGVTSKGTVLNNLARSVDEKLGRNELRKEIFSKANPGVKIEELSNVSQLKIPEGATIVDKGNGAFSFNENGKTIDINIDEKGHLTMESIKKLRESGLEVSSKDLGLVEIPGVKEMEIKAFDRVNYLDYGTAGSDLNELSLMDPKINAEGMVEIVTKAKDISKNALDQEVNISDVFAKKELKMIFRPDGSQKYLSFDIKDVGNGKMAAVIDPNSEIGKYLFKVSANGEVINLADKVHVGTISDGVLNSVATDVSGQGIELTNAIIESTTTSIRAEQFIIDSVVEESSVLPVETLTDITTGVPFVGYDRFKQAGDSGRRAQEAKEKEKKAAKDSKSIIDKVKGVFDKKAEPLADIEDYVPPARAEGANTFDFEAARVAEEAKEAAEKTKREEEEVTRLEAERLQTEEEEEGLMQNLKSKLEANNEAVKRGLELLLDNLDFAGMDNEQIEESYDLISGIDTMLTNALDLAKSRVEQVLSEGKISQDKADMLMRKINETSINLDGLRGGTGFPFKLDAGGLFVLDDAKKLMLNEEYNQERAEELFARDGLFATIIPEIVELMKDLLSDDEEVLSSAA